MAAHHLGGRTGEDKLQVLAPITIQCCQCHQRITCCPGCGMGKFVVLDGAAIPTRSANPQRAGRSSAQRTPAGPPTAFELFCRDAKERRTNDLCSCENDLADEEEERSGRRRFLAELWLSADALTRERYELAAAAVVVSQVTKPSRATGRKGSTSRGSRDKDDRDAIKPEVSKVSLVSGGSAVKSSWTCGDNSDAAARPVKSYKRPPTSFQLFCKSQRKTYGSQSALVNAWESMGAAEKQPYDDEAATIRVALKK